MSVMKLDNADAPTPPVGVIESLSLGFETVAGKLVLVLLPLLLDLLLWVGPHISFAPAIDTVINTYHDELWTPFVVSANPDMDTVWPQIAEGMADVLGNRFEKYLPVFNVPLIGIPVVMAGREASALPFALNVQEWVINSPMGMVGVWLLALIVGVVLGTLYMGLIAQQIRSGRVSLGKALKRWPVDLLWMGMFIVLLPILAMLIYMPFLILAAGFSVLSGVVMSVLAGLLDWGGRLLVLWVGLFFAFTIHGFMLHEKSLPGAIWDSVRVVQWNVTATMVLALLFVMLNLGMNYVWSMAPAGSWLTIASIIGNAFISTGLIAASFIFFKDRYRYWREMRAQLLAELERKKAQHNI